MLQHVYLYYIVVKRIADVLYRNTSINETHSHMIKITHFTLVYTKDIKNKGISLNTICIWLETNHILTLRKRWQILTFL